MVKAHFTAKQTASHGAISTPSRQCRHRRFESSRCGLYRVFRHARQAVPARPTAPTSSFSCWASNRPARTVGATPPGLQQGHLFLVLHGGAHALSLGGAFSIYEGCISFPGRNPGEPLGGGDRPGRRGGTRGLVPSRAASPKSGRRRGPSLWRYFRKSRESELIVVMGEDIAALYWPRHHRPGRGAARHGHRQSAFSTQEASPSASSLIVVAIGVGLQVQNLLIGEKRRPGKRKAMAEWLRPAPRSKEVYNLIHLPDGELYLRCGQGADGRGRFGTRTGRRDQIRVQDEFKGASRKSAGSFETTRPDALRNKKPGDSQASCTAAVTLFWRGGILATYLPLGPVATSKVTFWFSAWGLEPRCLSTEKWARSPPPSGRGDKTKTSR